MPKPILFAVDDDSEVLRAVERDLRRKYGSQFRILTADSGVSALESLKRLKLRDDPVALLLVDQRMAQMSGVELLEQSLDLYPTVKRVLLTAYADTEAAIKAINDVRLDYYLLKPWDPPEERLYPVLDDLLDDWQASHTPPFEGIRLIGHRWAPATHQLKDFLARNQVPYQWVDVSKDDQTRDLVRQTDPQLAELPLVLLPDGTRLVQPTNLELANKIGLRTHAELPFYDLVIVGGGPSGLAAAVYGASEGLRTVLVEREAPGGQAGMSSRIENYLGFPSGLSGSDLARRAVTQARRFGVEILTPQEITGIRLEDPYRIVQLSDGSELNCHALLIATGVSYRRLPAPGVDRLAGAGVFYGAATTEAVSAAGEDVFVVGGANSAGQAAMYLSGYARSVTMLVRGASLEESMSQYLIDQISATPNIHVRTRVSVCQVDGEERLETVTVEDLDAGGSEVFPAAALFIFIGAQPRTEWVADLVQLDSDGYILAGPDLVRDGTRPRGWKIDRQPFLLETSVPGIFVVGDVRHHSIKRIATAVGEGSMAVQFVHQYLSTIKVS